MFLQAVYNCIKAAKLYPNYFYTYQGTAKPRFSGFALVQKD